MAVQAFLRRTGLGMALAMALGIRIEAAMKHFQINQRMTFELASAPCAFRWFAAKTNRLALYNLHLPGLEFKLYVTRDWPDETPDEDDLIGA